jgi:hypothetical protein
MLELKDAATLHEYWVFVTICRMIGEILSAAPVEATAARPPWVQQSPLEATLSSDIEAGFPEGVVVRYQDLRREYSGGFCPDVTLTTPAGMWVSGDQSGRDTRAHVLRHQQRPSIRLPGLRWSRSSFLQSYSFRPEGRYRASGLRGEGQLESETFLQVAKKLTYDAAGRGAPTHFGYYGCYRMATGPSV